MLRIKGDRFLVILAISLLIFLNSSVVLAKSVTYRNSDIKFYYTDISGTRDAAYFDLDHIIFYNDPNESDYPLLPIYVIQQGLAVSFNRVDNMGGFTSISDLISQLKLLNPLLLTLNGVSYNNSTAIDNYSNIYGDNGGQNISNVYVSSSTSCFAGGSFYVFGAGSNVFWTNTGSGSRTLFN